MNWNKTEDVGVPKQKFATSRSGVRTMSVSTELIASDGITLFVISYVFDMEGEKEWFLKNVTHWIELEKIPVPTN